MYDDGTTDEDMRLAYEFCKKRWKCRGWGDMEGECTELRLDNNIFCLRCHNANRTAEQELWSLMRDEDEDILLAKAHRIHREDLE